MLLVELFRLAGNQPKQQGAIAELARRNFKTIADVSDGVGETAALMLTASAAEIVSGYAGMAGGAVGDSDTAANAVRVVQELMTYQPKTEGGQKAMKALGESIVGQFGEVLMEASGKLGDATYNATGNEALAALAYSAPTLALEAGVLKPFTKAGKAAAQAGMYTPKIFAGAMAKTADIPKMKAAQELAKRGVSRDEIWQKTGWFNDVDGNWKFEIDDSGAKYMQPDSMSPTASKYNDLQQRLYADLNMTDKDARGWMEFEGIEGVSPADYKAQVIAQTRKELGDIKGGSYPLMRQVLEHDELGKAYPDTNTMRVKYQGESMRDFAGEASYLEADDMLTLTENSPLSKSAALHEVQHGIQGREGFARGGSPDRIRADLREVENLETNQFLGGHMAAENAIKDMQRFSRAEYIAKLDNISKSANPKPSSVTGLSDFYEYSDQIRERFGAMPKTVAKGRDEWLRSAAAYIRNKNSKDLGFFDNLDIDTALADPKKIKSLYAKASRALNKNVGDAKAFKAAKKKWAETNKMTDMELYQRLAGEAEARNVQTRMDYTPEQRAANPPWKTLDVPEDELIVR